MIHGTRPERKRTATKKIVIIKLRIAVETVESTPLLPDKPTFPNIATNEAEAAEISA